MYFTKTKPLNGTIKHRYSDFIVKEILLDNSVCRFLEEGEKENIVIPDNLENKEFLHFTLQKTNMDVQNAIKLLALNQKCGKSRIGFAGLKDKRGITSQRISIYMPNIELLQKLHHPLIKIFDFSWENKRIELGDLKGNFFKIIIRDVGLNKKEIEDIFFEFKNQIKDGIPNYFGQQRFGGIRQVTHLVGKLFFEGKIKEAVLLYLGKTNDKEDQEIKDARILASNEKYLEAFKLLKGNEFRYERAILNSLIKEPNDFVKAFQQLPKNLMILFPHAYQSFLFNNYLDLRMKTFGDIFEKQKEDKFDENGNILGPLFGFNYQFSEGVVGELEKKILENENIKLEQFKVNNFPQMSVEGTYRNISLHINNLELISISEDNYFEGKNALEISFNLTKNSYATTVINELMKND